MIEHIKLSEQDKINRYEEVIVRISALLEGETDEVAALSTVACELHHGMPGFHWTGFYRKTTPELLTVGPYQGGHGCLRIPFNRGICGESARTKSTVLVKNVHEHSDHIACSSTTISELVVPVFNRRDEVMAVLDLDSDYEAHYDKTDQKYCEQICRMLSRFYN